MQPGAAFVIHLQPLGSGDAVTGSAAVSEEALPPSSVYILPATQCVVVLCIERRQVNCVAWCSLHFTSCTMRDCSCIALQVNCVASCSNWRQAQPTFYQLHNARELPRGYPSFELTSLPGVDARKMSTLLATAQPLPGWGVLYSSVPCSLVIQCI